MSEQATDLWPGMLVIQLTSYVRKQLNLSRKTGRLIIALVEKGSPAYTAGLIAGDVISSIDGNQVRDLLEFYTALACRRGRTFHLCVQRQGKEVVIQIPSGS